MRYQHPNHQGSCTLETDDNGQIINYEEYHPFGTTSYQATDLGTKASAKRYRFTGMERDEETGLNYHNARYYIPWLGRWLNPDPIGISDGVNVYAYCGNNPVTNTDTKGTQMNKFDISRQDVLKTKQPLFPDLRKPYEKNPSSETNMAKYGKGVVSGILKTAEINAQLKGLSATQVLRGNELKSDVDKFLTDTNKSDAQKFNLYAGTTSFFLVDESATGKDKNNQSIVILAMLQNFVSGKGPENYYFKENGPISAKFFDSKILHTALGKYLDDPNAKINEKIDFGLVDLVNDAKSSGTLVSSIVGFVGSARINITNTEMGIEIQIYNITSLTSGTFGKEPFPTSMYPVSSVREPGVVTPYSNISQTYNLFIPFGTGEEGKYAPIEEIFNNFIE